MLMATNEERSYDPLLESLAVFARRFHRPISVDALVAGLPVKPRSAGPELFSIESSKALFSRVAHRAGFATRLIQRDLSEISDLLLPCILVLHGRNACILETIDRESNRAKIILPELSEGEEWVSLPELEDEYLGFAFLVKPEYQRKNRPMDVIKAGEGHWFWGTLRRCKEIFVSVLVGSVMINVFALAMPLFTMNVYDRVVPNNAVETLWVLALGVGLVLVFDALLRFLRNYLLEVAGKKSDVIMSSIIFEQVMNLRMEVWPRSVGAFTSRLGQFESIRHFFTSSTLVTLVDLPFAIIFLIVIAYIGDPLVAVPLVTMGALLLFGLILVRPMRKSIEGVIAASAAKNSMLVESLGAVQTLKTLGAHRYSQWAWEEATGEIAARSLRTRMLSGSISVVTNVLVQLNTVGIVVLGVYQIVDLKLSMGALIAVVILSSRAISPMAQVAGLITNYQQTKAAFASLEELMSLPVEREEAKSYVRPPSFQGAIECSKLQFTYPESESPTLSGIDLKIAPGERVGIIGRVGCGKSTLARMLVGLYQPTGGSLTVDGIDIGQIDPADLRRNVAYLSQESELINATIRDNITLKDPSVTDEQVLAAAHAAGVDLFVNRMPRGFDTTVGEHGAGLSGGQRQSIALARTLLLGEPILLLDEPTNAMDNTTEGTVRKRLRGMVEGKTVLLITHKAAMLELVDRLVVIEDGAVAMDGPKEQIMRALAERGPRDEA
jgi:ATP-binding cassette subfamily C protein LapB